jgi:hypothetical protein
VQPYHTEKGPLYITRGLVRVMETFPWSPQSDAPVQAYLALVHLSAALAQRTLPYHVPGLQSNDVLYAGEPAYGEEVLELTHELVQKATDASGVAIDGAGGGGGDGGGNSGGGNDHSGGGGGGGDEGGGAGAGGNTSGGGGTSSGGGGGGGTVDGPWDTPAKRMARANLDLANAVAVCCRPTAEIQGLVEALVGRGKATLKEYDPYLQHTQRFVKSRLKKTT